MNWTIKSRIRRWILLLILGQVLVLQVPTVLIVSAVLDRELSNLLEEELAEFQSAIVRIRTSGAEVRDTDLVTFVDSFSERHPRFPLALELWSDGTLIGRAGPEYLIAKLTFDPQRLEERVDAGNWIAWRAEQVDGGIAAVIVDGRVQRQSIVWLGLTMTLLVLLWGAAGLAVGLVLARLISTMMTDLGSGARALLAGEATKIDSEGLPEEVAPFVHELRVGIENLDEETGRFRVMAAGLAHELSAPIQNLIAEMEVALMKERDPVAYRHVLESNLDEMRDLGEAVHNLLLLCSERRIEQVVEEFDLAFELGLRLSGERRQALRKGVELGVDFEGDLHLAADREAILRALRNLVANAIAWTPVGGVVHLEVRGHEEALVAVIEDEGPGVPAELRDKVFEPFFRGPSGPGRRAGYGLGLAMAKAAAESAGGSLELSAAKSGGARFCMRLPRSRRVRD